VDQVLRHAPCQRLGSYEHVNLPRVTGEMHRGLSGGVRSAHQINVFVRAGHHLGLGSTVVDAGTGEAVGTGNVQLAVADTGGDQGDVTAQLAAIAHATKVIALFRAQA